MDAAAVLPKYVAVIGHRRSSPSINTELLSKSLDETDIGLVHDEPIDHARMHPSLLKRSPYYLGKSLHRVLSGIAAAHAKEMFA